MLTLAPQDNDVVRFTAGFSRFALVCSPDLVHRVLVSESGKFGEGKWTERASHYLGDCLITREAEPHAQRRALLDPSFGADRFGALDSIVVSCCERLAGRWRPGQTLDVLSEMGRITIAASGRALFGVDVEPEVEGLVPALSQLRRDISRLPFPLPGRIAARRRLRRVISGLCRGPMVERLRAAHLSQGAVESEVLAMLFASFDTTSSALGWAWFAIGQHPEVEAKLHAELDEVLGGRVPTLEDLPRLRYSRAVITEVLRLYPPVHFVDRRALCDVDLGGVRVRSGEYILLSPLLTQRLARFYEQPARFWPERWVGADVSRPPRYAYFPFGDGPHVCIGRGLALRVAALAIATLARHWRFEPSPALPDPGPNAAILPMMPERRT